MKLRPIIPTGLIRIAPPGLFPSNASGRPWWYVGHLAVRPHYQFPCGQCSREAIRWDGLAHPLDRVLAHVKTRLECIRTTHGQEMHLHFGICYQCQAITWGISPVPRNGGVNSVFPEKRNRAF